MNFSIRQSFQKVHTFCAYYGTLVKMQINQSVLTLGGASALDKQQQYNAIPNQ